MPWTVGFLQNLRDSSQIGRSRPREAGQFLDLKACKIMSFESPQSRAVVKGCNCNLNTVQTTHTLHLAHNGLAIHSPTALLVYVVRDAGGAAAVGDSPACSALRSGRGRGSADSAPHAACGAGYGDGDGAAPSRFGADAQRAPPRAYTSPPPGYTISVAAAWEGWGWGWASEPESEEWELSAEAIETRGNDGWDVGVLDLDPRRVEVAGDWVFGGTMGCAIDARTRAFDFDLDPVPNGVQSAYCGFDTLEK
ncbi:hypothetical protein B0H14DRAFT_2607968 [Mycena olivaceomarginata]|nr:hypothetical protein B0H14DRAFT_2607968 [Mycena olivaceomarginata]